MIRKRADCIWIAWQKHRRTDGLVARLGLPLYAFASRSPRLLKHPIFALRTLVRLLLLRPRVLIVQNPSIVLTVLAIAWKPLLDYRLFVDAHNAGIYPFQAGHAWLRALFPLLHRGSDITLVTKKILADIVRANGGRPFVLPDALPNLAWTPGPAASVPSRSGFTVTFVCTFAADEPYLEVIEAARLLPPDVAIRATGDPQRMCDDAKRAAGASPLRLLGYLPEAEYVETLAASDVVMDLTTFPDCLVCGAYEAVSLGIPLILSDTPASRQYFTRGTVYADNTAAGIVNAVLKSRRDIAVLRSDIAGLRDELEAGWQVRLAAFKEEIGRRT